MLQETFIRLLGHYPGHQALAGAYWEEIMTQYTAPQRHYHNLHHLRQLLEQLLQVRTAVRDWNAMLFTLYYHDIVYDPRQQDNEAQSALIASERLERLGVPAAVIQRCTGQIAATATHTLSADSDTNYFTDADLSILGQGREVYEQYYRAVRLEYDCYPDDIYIPGRKKVLEHFLSMSRIFKTGYFHSRLEVQARDNIAGELEYLQG